MTHAITKTLTTLTVLCGFLAAQEVQVLITTPDGKKISGTAQTGRILVDVEKNGRGIWGVALSQDDAPAPPNPVPAPIPGPGPVTPTPAPVPIPSAQTPLQKSARGYVFAVASAQRQVAAAIRAGTVKDKASALALQNTIRDQVRKDYAAALDAAVLPFLDPNTGAILNPAGYASALEDAVSGIPNP